MLILYRVQIAYHCEVCPEVKVQGAITRIGHNTLQKRMEATLHSGVLTSSNTVTFCDRLLFFLLFCSPPIKSII